LSIYECSINPNAVSSEAALIFLLYDFMLVSFRKIKVILIIIVKAQSKTRQREEHQPLSCGLRLAPHLLGSSAATKTFSTLRNTLQISIKKIRANDFS
jgi:hypothetical protein